MKLTMQDLLTLLLYAQETCDEGYESFGFSKGNYHFYIYKDTMIGDDEPRWVIEPNVLDEDGSADPCGEVEVVRYQDYYGLLTACMDLAEAYFKED